MADDGTHAAMGDEPQEGLFFTPLLPVGGALAGHAVGEMTITHRRRELDQQAATQSRDGPLQLTSRAKHEQP